MQANCPNTTSHLGYQITALIYQVHLSDLGQLRSINAVWMHLMENLRFATDQKLILRGQKIDNIAARTSANHQDILNSNKLCEILDICLSLPLPYHFITTTGKTEQRFFGGL